MSDYTSTFTKGTGDTVEAADFSTEFDAIATASATKYDSTTGTLVFTKVNDSNGNEVLEFGETASALNHVRINNNSTGGKPVIRGQGEADIGLDLKDSNSEFLVRLDAATSGKNYVVIEQAATGGRPVIRAGSSTNPNVSLELQGYGTGTVVLPNDSVDSAQIADDAIQSAQLNTTPTTGTSVSVSSGSPWTPSDGFYSWVSTATVIVELNVGGTWRSSVAGASSGTIIADGTNMRLNYDAATATVYYYKF